MFVGRIDEIEIVRAMLSAPPGASTSIVSFHGLFGAGKTTLLRKIRSVVEAEGLVDAIMATNEDIAATTLPEFVYALASGFHSLKNDVFRPQLEETDARRRRYLEIAGQLGADAVPLLKRVRGEQLSTNGNNGDHQVEADALALEVAIKSQFSNRDDQRLTLDTANVVTEALLVDLMTTFFPLSNGSSLEQRLAEKGRRRILIVIDTFEKITSLVNPWLLESFLPYVYQKRFGDFQSYRTSHLPDHIPVREFFDIRIIVAGRERLSLTDHERRWDRYRDAMREHRIGPFTNDELADFLMSYDFEPDEHLETVAQLTKGLPYLASLWVDVSSAETAGSEGAFLNALAEQRIFWYKSPEQQEWIRSAAFLEWFDADALRCFAAIGDDAPRAFEYLRNSSEVAGPSRAHPGKFEVHEIIRLALRDATMQESGERAADYREAADAFYNAHDILAQFGAEQRFLLRRLVYFTRFDDVAIERHFGGEAQKVRDVLDDASNIIVNDESMRTVEPDVRRRLARYNRCADRAH
ncbi:MAG: ATP-binding protein, partial [bacterium]|nr:ATP-binding protein [Candidatus Kapabacteria bacterium]